MKISFLLPPFSDRPIGGYKTVFELANQFCSFQNHEIRIVYLYDIKLLYKYGLRFGFMYFKSYLSSLVRFTIAKKEQNLVNWYDVSSNIRQELMFRPNSSNFSEEERILVTSWQTALWVERINQLDRNNVVYYVQHDETHFHDSIPSEVIRSWCIDGFIRVVTADWLKERLLEFELDSFKIQIGIDEPHFYIKKRIRSRVRKLAVMLYHEGQDKGSIIGIKAAEIVKSKYPDFELVLFSVFNKPSDLPDWIDYRVGLDREELSNLMNDSMIFIGPSLYEGWGLPGCEAALCGNALCMSKAGGHLEYSKHNQTALLSEIGSVEGLAENIIKLLNEDDLRIKLAENSHELVAQLTWDKAVAALSSVLLSESKYHKV